MKILVCAMHRLAGLYMEKYKLDRKEYTVVTHDWRRQLCGRPRDTSVLVVDTSIAFQDSELLAKILRERFTNVRRTSL
jgi:hypothetical protein